jgi:hypothetical protein
LCLNLSSGAREKEAKKLVLVLKKKKEKIKKERGDFGPTSQNRFQETPNWASS